MGDEFRFRRLEQWRTGGTAASMALSIPLPQSPTGLVLRWCPNPDCRPRRFQIGDISANRPEGQDRIQRRAPGSPGCTCPYCGQDHAEEDFIAPEDRQAAMEMVQWAVQEDVGRWLDDLAKDFNRRVGGRSSLLRMQMTSSHRPRPKPRQWREDLLRAMQCHLCACSYGVYAIAFFCPDCGASNLTNHFEREVALIVAQVDLAEAMQERGARELAFRLLGNAHEDVVTAFEAYLKSSFRFALDRRPGIAEQLKPRHLQGNPFQSLRRAAELFDRLSVDLLVGFDEDERGMLRRDFEKRHVIGHNLGLADEKYAQVVADSSIGETVPLLGGDIDAFARRCLRVVQAVEQALPELRP